MIIIETIPQAVTISLEMPDYIPAFLHLGNDVDPDFLLTISNRNTKCAYAIAQLQSPLLVTC